MATFDSAAVTDRGYIPVRADHPQVTRKFIKYEQTSAFDASEDEIRLLPLSIGMLIERVTVVVSTDADSGAQGNIDVGYKQFDAGGRVGTITDDTDYFINGAAATAVGTVIDSWDSTAHEPFEVTERDIYLTMNPASDETSAQGFKFQVIVEYSWKGTR